jgi:hypothetical protein
MCAAVELLRPLYGCLFQRQISGTKVLAYTHITGTKVLEYVCAAVKLLRPLYGFVASYS